MRDSVSDWLDEIPSRRLPVYFLLDTSRALLGTNIVSVTTGVQALCQRLAAHPVCRDVVSVSTIAFGGAVRRLDLAPVEQFALSALDAAGDALLGEALGALEQSLRYDLLEDRPGRPGDFKPFVFCALTGAPVDDWRTPAAVIAARARAKGVNVTGCAFGNVAARDALAAFAPTVMTASAARTEIFESYFRWVTTLLMHACEATGVGDGQPRLQAPALPPEFALYGARA